MKGRKPETGPLDGDDESTLDEFLVACQKSLARAVRSARQAAKSDSAFGQGERPLYMIDNLDIDLNVGVRLVQGSPEGGPDKIALNFVAPSEDRSRLRFSVTTKAIELQTGARLELANLDSLGEHWPIAKLRLWLVDDQGMPEPNYEVTIHIARVSGKSSPSEVRLKTDSTGTVEIQIDPTRNLLQAHGGNEKTADLSIKTAKEYCVWASCQRSAEWQQIADPRHPHPPLHKDDSAGAESWIYTELLRLQNA